MKRAFVLFLILLIVLLSACSKSSYDVKELEKLIDNYSLEQAKSDGCLVMENGDVTSGQETFDRFLDLTQRKEDANIRIVNYYTLGDKSRYSEELYEKEKGKYPKLYITDVVYKDDVYTKYSYEDSQLISKMYKYMIKDEFTANPEAVFTKGLYYILVNDKNVTWDDIFKGLISSKSGSYIDHFNIYQKHTYK